MLRGAAIVVVVAQLTLLLLLSCAGGGASAASFTAAADDNGVETSRGTVVVDTPLGSLTGFINRYGGSSFRGVPYATPPVGNLRFSAPQPPVPWGSQQPRNATVFGPGCVSKCNGRFKDLMCAATISEDCLYLNVYTPLNFSSNASSASSFPVIFFIHGGMFTWGSGGIPLYDGSRWAVEHQVIVVTINYRLNIFGALYTGTTAGNFNILDQRMALQWVQSNIAAFGGDNTRVVLSGQSAGATSVGIHMIAPASWPLFQRAAVVSNPWGIRPPSAKMAKELGDLTVIKLGCPVGGAAELACLRNQSAEVLLKMSEHTDFLPTPNEVLADFLQWSPYIDGEIIPQQPLAAFGEGKFNPVPLLIGTVANETIPFIFGINFEVPWYLMDVAIDYVWGISKGTEIELEYGPVPEKNASDARGFFSRIFTDYAFYCPTRYAAMQHNTYAPNVSTYVYFFDEHPSWATWYAQGNRNDPCVKWICHAFDLPTIFGTYYELPPGFPAPTAGEAAMTHFVQRSWASFAHTGRIEENWPRFTSANLAAYNISTPIPTAPLHGYRKRFCDMFDRIGYNRW